MLICYLLQIEEPSFISLKGSLKDLRVNTDTRKVSMASKPGWNESVENGLYDVVNEEMSPSYSLNMSTGEDQDLALGTLEACLKLALNQKSASEVNVVRLQRELDDAKARLKILEHAIRVRTSKANQFAKSLSASKTDQETLQNQLELSQQQLNETVEKNSKLQKLYTESLKEKNNKIKELEKDNKGLQHNQASPLFYSRSPLGASISSVYSSKDDIFVRPLTKVNAAPPATSRVFTSRSGVPAKSSQHFDLDPCFGGLKIAQQEVDKMAGDYDKLQQSYTESLREKNEKIKQLEEWFKTLKSRMYSSRMGSGVTTNAIKNRAYTKSNSVNLSDLYTCRTPSPTDTVPEVHI